MKEIDLKSTLVAGVIGAVLLTVVYYFMGQQPTDSADVASTGVVGFIIGAGVQVGVRLTGVS